MTQMKVQYISILYRTILCKFLLEIRAKLFSNMHLNLHYHTSAVVQFLFIHPVCI